MVSEGVRGRVTGITGTRLGQGMGIPITGLGLGTIQGHGKGDEITEFTG